MSLAVHTFTISGRDLLSAASATKTIDIDHIYCIESEVSQSDILSQPKTYFSALASNKLSARVTSAGDDPDNPGRSRIVIEVRLTAQASEDVTMKTLVVTAHTVDAGVDGEEATFYGISDPVGIVIPYSTSIPVKQNLSFSFAFTPTSSITVDGDLTSYLLESEVNRFVTTHKAGEPSQGDSQDIRGTKAFVDGIATTEIGPYDDGENQWDITLTGYLIPQDDSVYLGDPDHMFRWLYTDGVFTGYIQGDGDYPISLYSNLFPHDNTIMLGDSDHPYALVQANSGIFTALATDVIGSKAGNTPITLNNSIIPAYDDAELGGENDPFLSVYAENIHGLVPNLYTRDAQTPEDYNPAVPVGAVVMINLRKSDYSAFSLGARVSAGEVIPSGGGTLHDGTTFGWVHIAQYRLGSSGDLSIDNEYTTNASRGDLSTNMKFRAICGVKTTVSTSQILPVLAMRIE